jgi:tetratricopeptide (TPR) repeat protein
LLSQGQKGVFVFNRYSRAISILFLTGATAVTYANSLTNSFHYDDFHGIVRNPIIKDLRNIVFYFTDPSTFSLSHHDDWRPILQITYALNYLLGGLEPTNFRVFNLLIHIASAILVYLIIDEITRSLEIKPAEKPQLATFSPALVAGLLFALHPANSEIVNYIWTRSSLLACFFYLVGFYCFLRGPLHQGDRVSPLWHVGAFGSYILGLGTKATAITLPAVLLLYEFLRSHSLDSCGQGFRKWMWVWKKRYIPLTLVGLFYVTLRIILLPDSFSRVVDSEEISRTIYLFSSFRAWLHYLALFLWPHPLLVNSQAFGWSHSLWDAGVITALVSVIILLRVAWQIRRSQFVVTFFTFWFFLALLPEQSFLPLSEPINGYRPYLAYVGLSVALSQALQTGFLWLWNLAKGKANRDPYPPPQSAFCLILIVLMITLATWTIRRNQDWRDEKTLWSDVLLKDPDNPRAHMSLSLHLIEQGEYSQAEVMLERAISLAPKNSYGYLLRAYFDQLFDRDETALQNLTTAVDLNPRSMFALFYRGELLAKEGKYTDAIRDYERALALKHYFTDARFGLAMVFLQRQDLQKGKENCERILVIDRRDVRAYKCLGRILMERKDFAEASKVYERGLAYLPANKELWHDLSLTYVARGMLGPASVAYQKSTSVSPGSPN